MTEAFDTSIFASGREYSMTELMRAAWRHFFRNLGGALVGVGRLLLLTAALAGAVLIVFSLLAATLWTNLDRLGLSQPDARVLLRFVLWPAGVFVVLMLLKPFQEGLLWGIVQSFQGEPISWDHMTQPWQPPWRRPMLGYAALYAATKTPRVAIWLIFWLGIAPPPTAPAQLALIVAVAFSLFDCLVLAVTLLVGPLLLLSPQPRLWQAIRDQWQIMRGQVRRLALIVGLWLAATLLTGTSRVFFVHDGLECMALPLAFVGLCFDLYFMFLAAAFLRGLHGLPLDPEPASTISSTVNPLGLGVMPRRMPDHPLPPIPFDDAPPPETEPQPRASGEPDDPDTSDPSSPQGGQP